MSVTPTRIGGSSVAMSMSQTLVEMRAQLTDLQRQLTTGKRTDSYAGLGADRSLTVGLRQKLSQLDGYSDTAKQLDIRLNLASTVLGRMDQLGRDTKTSTTLTTFAVDQNGQTEAQRGARTALDEVMSLLNTRAGDRYLFSGRAVDRPAVVTSEALLEGEAGRAGLKQIIAERRAADLGSGDGRVAVSAAGPAVTLAEDVAGSPFGLKLASATTTIAGATIAGPAGAPATLSVTFGAQPTAGESLTVTYDLPDGTQASVTLRATAASPAGAGEFTIGATTTDTAANLRQALADATGHIANTALVAASAAQATDEFFAGGPGNPPLRVQGPPFDTAMALAPGTAADTMIWYQGEASSDPARTTAVAKLDTSINVAYGMRANEQGLRELVRGMALLAATNVTPGAPEGSQQYAALKERVGAILEGAPGDQRVTDIHAEITSAQTANGAAKTRHNAARSAALGLLEGIETVPPEEAAAHILALQTRLQAALQTTAMLSQTTLVNFL